jgi:hypothetical protein
VNMGMIFVRSRTDHHSLGFNFNVEEEDGGNSLAGYSVNDEVMVLFRVSSAFGRQFENIAEEGITCKPDLLNAEAKDPPYLMVLHFTVVAREHTLDWYAEYALEEIMHGVHVEAISETVEQVLLKVGIEDRWEDPNFSASVIRRYPRKNNPSKHAWDEEIPF